MGDKMKKRVIAGFLLAAVASLSLCGCSGDSNATYADGTYEGESSLYENDDGTEDGNGYGVVTLTIQDNTIVDCTYQTFTTDGTLKDEEYGKEGGEVANRDYYNKAQKAVAACPEYASQLVETGSIKEVDAISGATVNYNEFVEAVKDALNKAKE